VDGVTALDLILLGSLRDPVTDRYYFFDPATTTFALELASMPPTFDLRT
jgi:hypothetical protein